MQEGQIWEAAMTAAQFSLDNVCAVVDDNGVQLDGPTKDIMDVEPLGAKFAAFGWEVLDVDGHSLGRPCGTPSASPRPPRGGPPSSSPTR